MLKGHVVIVTGGAGLIGRAFVESIAEHGGTAVIASRNEETAQQVLSEVQSKDLSGRAIWQRVDITDPDQVTALFCDVHEKFGRIDAVVNNALPRNDGYGRKFEDVTLSDFNANVNSHLGGYFLVCQKAIDYFTTQGHGNIINLGSIYGAVTPKFDLYAGTPMTKEIEYYVSKAAIVAMTSYLAAYCKGRNIRINTLSPGGIFDDQPAQFVDRYKSKCLNKGMLSAEDVAGTLTFLLSDLSKQINGQNIVVDDGFSIS